MARKISRPDEFLKVFKVGSRFWHITSISDGRRRTPTMIVEAVIEEILPVIKHCCSQFVIVVSEYRHDKRERIEYDLNSLLLDWHGVAETEMDAQELLEEKKMLFQNEPWLGLPAGIPFCGDGHP